MSRREIELVTALAEGVLEDESEARALIERSARLRSIYEEQKLAVEALQSLPQASLTESEKSDLRRDVWTALRAPETTPTPARLRPAVLGYVAVFALVSVGLVVVLNGAIGGGATGLTFTGAEASSDTTLARSDSVGAPESTPPPVEIKELQKFLTASELARGVKDGTIEMTTAGSAADFDDCRDEAVRGLQSRYRFVGTIERDGIAFGLMLPPGVDNLEELVVVDLAECEVAYPTTDDR